MKYILIRLGDNDFHRTFINLLDTIHRAIDEHNEYMIEGEQAFSETEIINLIKDGMMLHYRLFQNCDDALDELPKLEDYFRNHLKVLFDDKAQEYIKEGGSGNSEAWCLNVETGMITTE
jgi:hypothetical protein